MSNDKTPTIRNISFVEFLLKQLDYNSLEELQVIIVDELNKRDKDNRALLVKELCKEWNTYTIDY